MPIAPDAPTIGIDFGGTKMLGVIAGPDGAVLADARMPTPYSGEALLDAVAQTVTTLEAQTGVTAAGVGVGAAGLVDLNGVLHYGPNVGRVTDIEVLAGVQQRLPGRRVVVDNDNTCATLAEFHLGASKGTQESVFVGLGTGIGGGIITRGELMRGANGFSAECGHMTVEAVGLECICGKTGCWEAYASGRALGRMGREAASAGIAERILELAGGSIEDIRGEHVTKAAREGDATAFAIIDRLSWWLAVGIANLIAVLDPQLVVVGGGMSGESDLYFDATQSYIAKLVFGSANRPSVPVVAAQLGTHAGAIGASIMARDVL